MMWQMVSSTGSVRHSRPDSSWRFSRGQRQLLWLGVTTLVLAQCSLVTSLKPSLNFELISKSFASPVDGLPAQTEISSKTELTLSKSVSDSQKPDPLASIKDSPTPLPK